MKLSYTSLSNMVATKNMWLRNILIVAGETAEPNFNYIIIFLKKKRVGGTFVT